jgi:methionyl-tRNA formyltransferase
MSGPGLIVATQRDWVAPLVQDHWVVRDLNALHATDWVFFILWHDYIPARIYEKYRCVLFHMTDVPYGRGGSPLQNLILRGHTYTYLSAIKVVKELDAGPVYLKRRLYLGGSAGDIYRRAVHLALAMVDEIVRTDPEPIAQQGEVVTFKRRTPAESEIPLGCSGEHLYDFIRMLDAPDYPRAFIRRGDQRLEFWNARWDGQTLTADMEVA